MNSQLEKYIKENLEKNFNCFLKLENLHPLLEQFKPIVKGININETSHFFEEELSKNIVEWWTNKDKDVDTDNELLGILFTYGYLEEVNCEALAYGIIESRVPLKKQVEPYHLDYHDYANGFYAMPGITMNFRKDLSKLHWREIDEDLYGDVEVYDLEGREELFNIYRFATELSLHYALEKLMRNHELSIIKMKKPFHFLIQAHDEEVRPVFIIE